MRLPEDYLKTIFSYRLIQEAFSIVRSQYDQVSIVTSMVNRNTFITAWRKTSNDYIFTSEPGTFPSLRYWNFFGQRESRTDLSTSLYYQPSISSFVAYQKQHCNPQIPLSLLVIYMKAYTLPLTNADGCVFSSLVLLQWSAGTWWGDGRLP